MKKLSLFTVALLSVFAASSVLAQEDMGQDIKQSALDFDDSGKDTKVYFDDVCCDSGAWFFDAEATFFRYHRADGVRAGGLVVENIEFGFEASPRLTTGFVGADGMGARVRYWEYDHRERSIENPATALDVNTYTIDFEIFQVVELGACTTVEFSGGLRYNDFAETMTDVDGGGTDLRFNRFHGWGGIFAVQAQRQLGYNGALYGRLRQGILMDDLTRFNQANPNPPAVLVDTVLGVTEIAFGYEYRTCIRNGAILSANIGVEWQQWQNYSSAFNNTAGGGGEDSFTGASDVGFAGFVVGLGLEY